MIQAIIENREQKKSGNNVPLVSIGMPTFNSNGRILQSINSILKQSYSNIEVIISDNCSTDNTQELCCRLTKKHPFIRYFRQERNTGIIPNFDFVLKQASGDFFMWIADDDTLEPGILNKYVDFLTDHPDYSLVSGQILHWLGNRLIFCERNLSLEMNSPGLRVFRYYVKVVYGAMFHGLMRKKIADKISMKNRIGDDWHFVAAIAYNGKIKNLDSLGYNKKLGGLSKNFKQYASAVKATQFAADFPRIQIAVDAFSDILIYSSVFAEMSFLSRFILATTSCLGILIKYYCKEVPFIIGGKIKRLFWKSNKSHIKNFQKI